MIKEITAFLTAGALIASMAAAPVFAEEKKTDTITYKYGDVEYTREMEKLGRGLTAIKTDAGVYLSWRLLGSESSVEDVKYSPSFNVYRGDELIASVANSTNYIDTQIGISYSVAPVINGVEGAKCELVSVRDNNYFDIKLSHPEDFYVSDERSLSYAVGDISCGDLDGDGEYELVVKWDANPQDSGSGYDITGNVLLDAYEMDGTHLWRVDLGRNIRSGEHYTQFLVYDFDMDGYAEVTAKTAPGSKDGAGNYVTEASADADVKAADNMQVYVNDGGRIITGPEYFTIFDGQTGAAVDTINYPTDRVDVTAWGDDFGNRSERYIADVCYLDGERPYAVYWRGYYGGKGSLTGRTGIFGASFDGERLDVKYIFDTRSDQPGYTTGNELYIGQGNHNMTTADVDNDGKDEFISGALCMEVNESDKLVPKWCSFRGHGDALHIGDYDPTHDGMEYFTVHESNGVAADGSKNLDWGMTVHDAADGTELFHAAGSKDTGRGVMANVGVGGYYQVWAGANAGAYMALGNGQFTGFNTISSMNFRIFWDGDLYDELLDGVNILDWNGSRMSTVFTASDCNGINSTKNVPSLQADLFGDWREEVIYPLSDGSGIRVYSTTELTSYKLPTLMHDPVYRSGVASEQSAYNQPPHIGYYLSDELFKTAVKAINITAPDKTEYNIGEAFDKTGIKVVVEYTDGTTEDIQNYAVSGYEPYNAGEQEISVVYRTESKAFTVNVNTDFVIQNDTVIGYSGSGGAGIVPKYANGVEIKEISDGALSNTGITDITIYENIEKIGSGNDFSGTIIHCYEGSAAHIYAVENGIEYMFITDDKIYYENIDYDGEEYSGFGIYQGRTVQSETIKDITYTVYGRSRGGDARTGFTVYNMDGSNVLRLAAGRFCAPSSHACIDINNVPVYSSEQDYVFSTRVYFPNDTINNVLSISDGTGEVDRITAASTALIATSTSASESSTTVPSTAGIIEHDKWYTYMLIYSKGVYYRFITDSDGNIVSNGKIGTTTADTAIKNISVYRQKDGSYSSSSISYAYMDDFQIYTSQDVMVNMTMKVLTDGKAVSGADVVIDGMKLKSDENGIVNVSLPRGVYNVVISAEDFISYEAALALYNNSVNKTVEIEKIPISAERIEISRERAGVLVRGGIALSASVYPANSTETDITWRSSDNSVAVVKDGYIRGVKSGEAVITASVGACSAECIVTVKEAGGYVPLVSEVLVTAPSDVAYIPESGENIVSGFTASVYDQYGVEIKDAKVSWSGTASPVDNGTLTVYSTAEEGSLIVYAYCEQVMGSVEIELKSVVGARELYVDNNFENAPVLKQGKTEQTVDDGDITYGVGARSSGGDGRTGISYGSQNGDKYMIMSASEFNGNNRNAYILFNNPPTEYSSGDDYVLETDICFPATEFTRTVTILTDQTPVRVLNMDGFEADTWYKYRLIRSKGSWIEVICDADGNLISTEELVILSDTVINRINFNSNAGRGTQADVYFDNMKLYKTDNAMSNLTVTVLDEYGQAIEGMEVTTAGVGAMTNENGRAVFRLPVGIYKAFLNNTEINAAAVGAASEYVYSMPMTASVVLDGNVVTARSPKEVQVYCAKYNADGTLNAVEIYDVEGESVFDAGLIPDKIFMWDGMDAVVE